MIEKKPNMEKLKKCLGLLLVMLLVMGMLNAKAQKATEIFIPIGESPGVSGLYSKIGTVSSLSEDEQTFILLDSLQQSHNVIVTDSSSIWLDCTMIKEKNVAGSFSDIKEGILLEVKYFRAADSSYTDIAEWIKIQITEHME